MKQHGTKRLFAALLALVMILVLLPAGVAQADDDVVQIADYEQMKAFAARVNDGEAALEAEHTADITCTDKTWTPIGTDHAPYSGAFDGQGHTIKGLSNAEVDDSGLSDDDDAYIGLFGRISSRGTAEDAAAEYPLWVGGVQVTAENAGDVLGDGTVKFEITEDGERVLTLNNAKITGYNADYDSPANISIQKEKWALTIKLIGENTLSGAKYGIEWDDPTTESKLTLNGGGTLTVNSTVCAIAISAHILIDGVTVEATGGKEEGEGIVGQGVTIKDSIVIASGNFSGLCSYNRPLNVTDSTVTAAGGDTGIYCGYMLTIGGSSIVTAESEERAIWVFSDITLNDGITMLEPVDAKWVDSGVGKKACNADGSDAKRVVIGKYVEYPLWVGGVQVTSANAGNVLGDGTVKFQITKDGENVLTLNNAKITGYNADYDKPANISVQKDKWALTIKLTGENTLSGAKCGIRWDSYTPDSELTLNGGGTLKVNSTEDAIEVSAHLLIDGVTVEATAGEEHEGIWGLGIQIKNSTVTVYSSDNGLYSAIDVMEITNSSVTATGTIFGMYCEEGLTIGGSSMVTVESNERAIWVRGTFTLNDGIALLSPVDAAWGALGTGQTLYETDGTTCVKKATFGKLVEYPLRVGGVQVTNVNAGNVLGDGTVKFEITEDGENVLTLNNAKITGTYEDSTQEDTSNLYSKDNGFALTVKLIGENSMSGANNAIELSGMLQLTGDGSLTAEGSNSGISVRYGMTVDGPTVEAKGARYGVWAAAGTLSVKGTSKLTAEGTNERAITAKSISLGDGLTITTPAGGTVRARGDDDVTVYDSKGNEAKKVVIEPFAEYPIWVCGVQVTGKNMGDVLGDGKVKFEITDEGENVLTLTNAKIERQNEQPEDVPGIAIEYNGALTIRLIGENEISGTEKGIFWYSGGTDSRLTLTGGGKLKVVGIEYGINAYANLLIDGVSVSATGSVYPTGKGIYCFDLEIKNSIVTANGWTGLDTGGSLKVTDSQVFAVGSSYYGISCSESITIDGNSMLDLEGGYSALWVSDSVTLNDGVILLSPSDASWGESGTGNTLYEADGTTRVKKAVFKKFVEYPLWVGGVQVTSDNMGDVLGDGTVKFEITEDGENVLTLTNANITGTYQYRRRICNLFSKDIGFALTVKLIGENSMSGAVDAIVLYGTLTLQLTGDGTLTAEGSNCGFSVSYGITVDGPTVEARGASYGVWTGGTLSVKGTSKLTAEGTSGMAVFAKTIEIGEGLSITTPVGARIGGDGEDKETVYDSNMTVATKVVIEPVVSYPLRVGGVQVTSANMGDVLNDGGSVKFEVTDKGENVLTLTNANITGTYLDPDDTTEYSSNLCTEGVGYALTVQLIGENSMRGADIAIEAEGTIQFVGSGTLTAEGSINGVTVYVGGVTVDGPTLTFKGKYFGLWTTAGSITVKNGKLTAEGPKQYAIIAKSLTLGEGMAITTPAGGRIGSYREDQETVYDSDGVIATKVVIEPVVSYPLWVGGEQVTGNNLSGEGWAFTPAEGEDPAVLELNKYSYTGKGVIIPLTGSDGKEYLTSAVIFYDDPAPLEVRLTGENTLIQTTTEDVSQAIALYSRSDADNALTIVGVSEDASLNAQCGTASSISSAIASKGGLTIKDLALCVSNPESAKYSYGVYAESDILIDGCKAEVTSGKTESASYGIFSMSAGIAINNSEIDVTSGDSDTSKALIVLKNDITITDSTVLAKGGKASGSGHGIYSYEGDVVIRNSTIEAASGDAGFRSDAIFAVNIDIEGSDVTATAAAGVYSMGLIGIEGTVAIRKSRVNAEGGLATEQSGGIYADSDLTIAENSTVKAIGKDATAEYGASTGFLSFGSTVVEGNSTVEATAAEGFESYGICAFDWIDETGGSSLTVTDSKVTATASKTNGYGIYTSTLNVGGESAITAIGSEANGAIGTEAAFVLSDDLVISDPFDSVYAKNESGMTVIRGADGKTNAQKVVIEKLVEYPLWIGGEQTTNAHRSGEGWLLTPPEGEDPAILELNNYSYSGEGVTFNLKYEDEVDDWFSSAVLYYTGEEPLEVRLTGENTLIRTETDNLKQVYAIYCTSGAENALTILGMDKDASLTATCGTAVYASMAIASLGGLTVRNLSLNAAGADSDTHSQGLLAKGVLVLDHCSTQVTNGAAYQSRAIDAEQGIKLVGGTLQATAKDGTFSYAIFVPNNDVEIESCEVTLASGEATNSSYGIYVHIGNVRITDSTVSCVSGKGEVNTEGIFACYDVEISGSKADIVSGDAGYTYAVFACHGNLVILDSEVYAEGGKAVEQSGGIYALKDITIGESSKLKLIAKDATGEYGSSNSSISFGSTVIEGNSTVEATAAEGFESYGICAYDWINGAGGSSLTITDSKVTASASETNGYGIYTNQLIVGGESTITAIGSEANGAIGADAAFVLTDNLVVSDPFDSVYAKNESGMTVIRGADGKTNAQKVVIEQLVEYPLWIGGEQATNAHRSGEGWLFTPAEGENPAILELNNYSYSGEGVTFNLKYEDEVDDWFSSAALYYTGEAPLEVRLTGKNTLIRTESDNLKQVYAINSTCKAENALTIIGMDEGASLTATCGTAEYYSTAVSSWGGLTIRNLSLDLTSTEGGDVSHALHAYGAILLDHCRTQAASGEAYFSGTIQAEEGFKLDGGTLQATAADGAYSYTIYVPNNDVEINSCEVTAVSGEGTDSSHGIFAYNGSILITDSTVSFVSGKSGESIEAICAYNDVRITGSKVDAFAGGGSYVYGIIASDGNVVILDSEVNAEGSEALIQGGGIYALKDVTIAEGSTVKAISVKATGEDSCNIGIICFGSIVIEGNSTVEATATGGTDNYGICVYDWINGTGDSSLTVTDSKVSATASETNGYGIYTSTLNVSGESEITAIGSEAIDTDAAFVLSDGIAIVAPFNGVYGTNDAGMTVVFPPDSETPASEVVLKKAATVTFRNEDGTVLQSGKVALGEMPVYYGETPTKPATKHFSYTFKGWKPEFVPVSKDTVYTAEFTEELLRPLLIGGNMTAGDACIMENGELLYRYDINVTDLLDGALRINSAQIVLTYDHAVLEFRKGEGPLEWLFGEEGETLSAVWASDTEVLLKDGDLILTLWFAQKAPVEPGTVVDIRFAENALGFGSALSFVNEGTTTELAARTQDGSILFDEILWGDANCDGIVTAADAALILRSLVGLSELSSRGAVFGDVDGDGEITAADAAMILRYVINLIDRFPAA